MACFLVQTVRNRLILLHLIHICVQVPVRLSVRIPCLWRTFGRVVCWLQVAALAGRFESRFYYPLFDDNCVQLRPGRKLLQGS